jgi:DNA-binding transcriptional regulator YdaS (Cro superfamily)
MNTQTQFFLDLLNSAASICGNDSALADRIYVSRQTVSHWRHGKKACPLGDVVLMADLCGEKVEDYVACNVIHQYADQVDKANALRAAYARAIERIKQGERRLTPRL